MDYTIESLGGGIRVCVSDSHRFGTDAFLLADFAAPRHKDRVCDLGTGCGILPLLFARWFQPQKTVGVELQPEAVGLAREGVRVSGLTTIEIVQADLTRLDIPAASFDLVVCNPPYKPVGRGKISRTGSDRIARHETACTIDDVCRSSARLLRFGGRLCLCQRAERLADTLCAMRAAGVEPKRLRFCAKDAGTPPWLFLVEGIRGGKPFMRILPILQMYDGQGKLSAEIKRIYRQEEED